MDELKLLLGCNKMQTKLCWGRELEGEERKERDVKERTIKGKIKQNEIKKKR